MRLLQYYEALALENDPRGYCVCTSEGKDSRVLGHLFRRAGVKHFYQHSITGIEPPELIYFQRSNFQQYRDAGYLTYDVMYRKSMWQLMLEKKIPPLRTIRYCCAELKEKRSEHQGKAVVSFGVRKYESVKRARSRNELEIALPRQKNLIMPFDDGENRKIFELCYRDRENASTRWRIGPMRIYGTTAAMRSWNSVPCTARASTGWAASAAHSHGSRTGAGNFPAGRNSMNSIFGHLTECWKGDGSAETPFWTMHQRQKYGWNGG